MAICDKDKSVVRRKVVEFDGLSAKDCLNKAGISRSHPVYTGIDGSCMEYLRQMILHHDNLLQVQAYLLPSPA